MPLREDLLEPIPGENPAGENLYYDPLFEQIREARREDEGGGILGGSFEGGQQKKVDYRAIMRMAGDALAKRSKDLRLAGFLLESQAVLEGFGVLAPCLDLLRQLQENFWELRMMAVEAAAHSLALAVRKVPLTKNGLGYDDYLVSRSVGYEKDATTSDKQAMRQDAIEHGRLTAEEFDQGFAASPKSLYVNATAALAEAQEALGRLDQYQRQAYGDNYPNLAELRSELESVHGVAELLLNERRKTEPDAVVAEPSEAGAVEGAEGEEAVRAVRAGGSAAQLVQVSEAYQKVVESAQAIFDQDPRSPVAYLVCAGLRLGETQMQDAMPAPGFAVAPPLELRQLVRNLANQGAWLNLLRESLAILADPSARAWLDLHRYIWRAGQETGAEAISAAVAGTIRSLLMSRPELRTWTLEDDTGAANPETQNWLDGTVLR
jgi:type VI secretion system protein ImpA